MPLGTVLEYKSYRAAPRSLSLLLPCLPPSPPSLLSPHFSLFKTSWSRQILARQSGSAKWFLPLKGVFLSALPPSACLLWELLDFSLYYAKGFDLTLPSDVFCGLLPYKLNGIESKLNAWGFVLFQFNATSGNKTFNVSVAGFVVVLKLLSLIHKTKLAQCDSTPLSICTQESSLRLSPVTTFTTLRPVIVTQHQWTHFSCCHQVQDETQQRLSTAPPDIDESLLPGFSGCPGWIWLFLGYFPLLSGKTAPSSSISPCRHLWYCSLAPLSWSKKKSFPLDLTSLTISAHCPFSFSLLLSPTQEETFTLGLMITS